MRIVKYLIVSLTLCFSISFSQSEQQKPTFALSASLQNSQFDILFAPFFTQNSAVYFGFGFAYVDKSYTDYSIGVIPKFYLSKQKKVSPYIIARAGVIIHSPLGGKTTTDIIAGIGIGGEYFLDEKFSLGIETQLNSIFMNLSNANNTQPNTTVNTATAFMGTIYF